IADQPGGAGGDHLLPGRGAAGRRAAIDRIRCLRLLPDQPPTCLSWFADPPTELPARAGRGELCELDARRSVLLPLRRLRRPRERVYTDPPAAGRRLH